MFTIWRPGVVDGIMKLVEKDPFESLLAEPAKAIDKAPNLADSPEFAA